MAVFHEDDDSPAPLDANPQDIANAAQQDLDPYATNVGVVGFCAECKSVQPDAYVERNIFYQQGKPFQCRYCGGVCVIVKENMVNSEAFRERLDRSRGIGSTIQPKTE